MPYAPPQTPAAPPRNGLGTAGFVLGLVGLVFSFIPIIGVVAWPMVILGLIFGAVGYSRCRSGRATNKGLSIAAVVLSIVGLLVCILYATAFAKAAKDINTEANKVATISYDAGGTSKDAIVTYSTFSDDGSAQGQEQPKLPWHKDVKAKGLFKGGALTVTAGVSGGTVTCKVTVDGVVKKTATASGPGSSASCDNF